MSGYQYDPPPDEQAARDLLRDRGWSVTEPQCPECHGWGLVNVFEPYDPTASHHSSGTVTMRQCPLGCSRSAYYTLTGGTNGFSTSTNVGSAP